jgi:hypothetical protein
MFFVRQKPKDGEYQEARSFLELYGHVKENRIHKL